MLVFLERVRGWQYFSIMAGIMLVGAIWPVAPVGLVGGLVLALFVLWLGAASVAVRASGEGRWRVRMPEAFAAIAFLFALLAYPLVWNQPESTAAAIDVWRMLSAIAIFVLADHVAIGLARGSAEPGGSPRSLRALGVYVGLAALCLTPLAIPLLHERIFRSGRPSTQPSIERPPPRSSV